MALASLVLIGCAPAPSDPRAPTAKSAPARVGSLPTMNFAKLDGSLTSLDVITEGRPTVLVLWATWCDECRRELGELARVEDRLRHEGAAVVRIAVGEDRAKVSRFVRDHQVKGLHLVDEAFQFADALGETRVPTFVLIDRRGQVVRIDHDLRGLARAAHTLVARSN